VYEPESVRPDLPIPLTPLRGAVAAWARLLTGLRDPSFGQAYVLTAKWLSSAVLIILLSAFLVVPTMRPILVSAAGAMAVVVVLRLVVLRVFERRQHEFERVWLDAQSEVLRNRSFNVVRFTVRREVGERTDRRVYDLTRPVEVDELLRRQAVEKVSGAPAAAEAAIDFAYSSATGEPAIRQVRRQLADIDFVPLHRSLTTAYVNFPHARYRGQPHLSKREQGLPARRTFWLLPGMVRVTVAADG
jgi:hypothetical protein